MRTIITFCVLAAILMVTNKVGAQDKWLQVHISPLSDTLGSFELLYVNLKYENKSTKTISCFIPYATNTVLQIRRIEPEVSEWKLCNEYGFNADLFPEHNGWYQLPADFKDERWYQIYPCSPDFSVDGVSFLPGRYECRLIYSPSDQHGVWYAYPESCKDCITSSFNFLVGPSDSVGEKLAIERLTSIKGGARPITHVLYGGGRFTQFTCEEQIRFLESFLSEFPGSYFEPYIHGALANSLILCEKKKLQGDPAGMAMMMKRILFHLGKACESKHPWLWKLYGYELIQHEKELLFGFVANK
ncbi:MAG: hypothetical protein KF852_00645 [Saprospiraceae bacterium]|nr:hypothetical protein [Saprospiraceae bacterium]